ncbi:helix-turn-helix transcriptional regulator [Eubacterium sp. 1001713B170207_170306_E7]|uniref:helix-turn-helix domain-containing protein n=1 Tax=Eubacterium sp. 1001713B170207_170306_E7 TaxID=2787097 RepID=UPI00189BA13C|nr:helix-turn-helix transcriptional regulator [Eubacterium sp. 1001713B170207_170306_E7]
MRETVGQRIKLALEINHMRQSDLSRKTGISSSSINQYISGNFEPKQQNLYLLAKALNVNEAWLMGYDVTIERSQNNSPLITGQEVVLLKFYRQLSAAGKQEALKRLEELTELQKYR